MMAPAAPVATETSKSTSAALSTGGDAQGPGVATAPPASRLASAG